MRGVMNNILEQFCYKERDKGEFMDITIGSVASIKWLELHLHNHPSCITLQPLTKHWRKHHAT